VAPTAAPRAARTPSSPCRPSAPPSPRRAPASPSTRIPTRPRPSPPAARSSRRPRSAGCGFWATRAGSPRTARRRTPPRGTGRPAPRAARSGAPSQAPPPRSMPSGSAPPTAVPSTTAGSPSAPRRGRPRRARGCCGRGSPGRVLLDRDHQPHPPVLSLGPELHERATLECLDRGQPQPHPGATAPGRGAVVTHLEEERAVHTAHPHPHPTRARVLVRVPQRLGEHGLRQRLHVLRHLHAVLPHQLERQVLVVAGEPRPLPAERGPPVDARRGGGARQR